MTTGFQRSRGGGGHATLADVEARMLASLAAQVVELLRDGGGSGGQAGAGRDDAADPLAAMVGLGASGPLPRPDDPVLARLLPDGYADDESEAADFRRYTEPGLRDRKAANAATVIADLVQAGLDLSGVPAEPGSAPTGDLEVELDQAGVEVWLRCLTDIRLALGTRLEVAEDDDERWEQLPDDDPAKAMHDVYDWLGFVQETLLRTMR